jgi:hypothetical protein
MKQNAACRQRGLFDVDEYPTPPDSRAEGAVGGVGGSPDARDRRRAGGRGGR